MCFFGWCKQYFDGALGFDVVNVSQKSRLEGFEVTTCSACPLVVSLQLLNKPNLLGFVSIYNVKQYFNFAFAVAVRFRLYFKGSGLHCSQLKYFVHFVTQLLVFLSENRILVTQPQDFLLPQIYFLVEAFYHFVPNSDLLFLLVFLFNHHG